MKSLPVIVESITQKGVWIFVMGEEFFLDFDRYSWFRDAGIKNVFTVKLVRNSYLRWPNLDVDLELECLADPDSYPLLYR